MQSSRGRDLVVGLFVLAGLLAIAYLSLQVGGLSYKGPGGLELVASFDEVGGLSERAPVRIAGVKVGQVESIVLGDDLRAEVTLDLDPRLELSTDTMASIRTEGLLGNQYIELAPGGEEEVLRSGERLSFTESAINLEKLIGSVVHGTQLAEGEEEGEGARE
jgi:phospholipid/cholesterol/gamma-HCH transport system substrate-binding protein